jgi:hypothetical protein
MAPLHPAPTISAGLALVTQPITHSAVGHTALVTYAVDNDTGLTVQQVADAVQSEYNAAWTALHDNNCTILPPTVLLGDGTNVPGFAIGSGGSVTGTNVFVGTPPNISLLIKKTTALAGKKNRGRIYMPFMAPATDVSENGAVDPSWLTAVQSAATDWRDDLAAANVEMCIANKTLVLDVSTGKKYVSHIGEGEVVTTLTVEKTVATQRRRMPRV